MEKMYPRRFARCAVGHNSGIINRNDGEKGKAEKQAGPARIQNRKALFDYEIVNFTKPGLCWWAVRLKAYTLVEQI